MMIVIPVLALEEKPSVSATVTVTVKGLLLFLILDSILSYGLPSAYSYVCDGACGVVLHLQI